MNVLFYIAAIVAIFSTVMVITRSNAVHALLFLIVSLLSIAMIFYTLGAPYAAVLEVIVYAGAIMILFVFVVMMLNLSVSPEDEKRRTSLKHWVVPIILVLVLFIDFLLAFSKSTNMLHDITVVGPKTVGTSMFTTYVLGAELAGILLLAGIVGAYHLGRTPRKNLHRYLDNEQIS